MNSTHNDLLGTIKHNLDVLSNVDLDFLNSTQNSNFLSSFYSTIDSISQFISDTSHEDVLLDEFVNYRKELSDVFNKKLQYVNSQCKELEKKLEVETRINNDAINRLKSHQTDHSPKDIEALISRQEMIDRLNQWSHSCELESIDIKNLKCRIDILQEKIDSVNHNSTQLKERNRLLYEFLSSALKLTILNIDENGNANLAILSETKAGSEQTWHRFSSSKDSDVSTCDVLWSLIEKSLSSKPHSLPLDLNTPKVNSIQLSSK
ncbi:hypothetical protein MACJ_001547 [Theileria orientalis]|uniref:Uncharacterized protein n=1 Tax=Theileria orientalis TaxID=68886 RepID=A0A976M8G6_THEOR|nr:hypothetical protein MACJ_001547 [Theileria orientalis]